MNEAVSLVQDLTGASIDVDRVQPQTGDVRHTGADLSKSRDILGYTPQVTLREGLKAQIDAASEPRP